MAEGFASLFNNQRTSKWESIPEGIANSVTASMSSALAPFISSNRDRLTADRTINVPADFATMQEAWNHICLDLDLNGFIVTMQLADGTHQGGIDDYPIDELGAGNNYIGGGYVLVNGNLASPGNVIVTSDHQYTIRITQSYLKIQNFEVRGTVNAIGAAWDGIIENGPGMRFGQCGGQHIHASSGGQIFIREDYSIVGGGSNHWLTHSESQIRVEGRTITLVGTPHFTDAFYFAGTDGLLDASGLIFVGSATGTKWFLENNSMTFLRTDGDIAVFPGDALGNNDSSFNLDTTRGPFPQTLASGSLSGNAVTITDIPFWVNKLTVHIINASSNTAADYPKVQISIDNGATYITTGYSTSGINIDSSVLFTDDSIISGFTGAVAADNWTLYGDIENTQFGNYPSSTFIGNVNTISAVVAGGMGVYPVSLDRVNAIRIKLNGVSSTFDGGTYKVIGSP